MHRVTVFIDGSDLYSLRSAFRQTDIDVGKVAGAT